MSHASHERLTDPGGLREEERTRAIYTAWMQQGLQVAEQLAATTTGATQWPRRTPPDARRAPAGSTPPQPTGAPRPDRAPPPTWTAAPDRRDALQDALRTGWLVALDSTAAAEGRGPLAGLTVAVKDVIDVAGLPTRNGTAGAMWSDPPESASAWQRLADAGARCVGKAATHEMAWGVTTPQIPHPQAVDKMAGGSSGGPAACVAAGVTSGALGTDTGGSVRIPAALCGVVGFRPTTGSVDMVGVTPLAPEQDVVGPLATDVATCAVLLEALLGRRLQTDALPGVPAGRSGDGVMPQPLRVGVLARPGRLQADVERAFGDTVDHLRGHGVEIVQCETALLRQAGSVSLLTMLRSSAALHAEAARANPGGLGGGTRALLTVGEAITTHDAQVVCRARSVLVAQTARLFADNELDAFLTPTTPCTAPPRLADEVDIAGRLEPVSVALTRFTAWASVTSMPAVSVPVPSRGLPIGMQLMAPPSHDDVCVSLALTVEEMTRRTTP